MTYIPLHHKYRPQTFADLVGQEAIAITLTNALQQQRIAPAYLFTGARGTGKTSSARIFAKSLNCLQSDMPTAQPCGSCDVCRAIANGSALDVIEIDAASNTGVDNIRELIERAQFAPVQCRYKVYVVDECHMLSTAAFNALLKTLEEPPDRVVFVLATTDPQRVLPTIISRCQRFDYRRIPLDAMVPHLRLIANQEAIPITDEAITLIAQISQGGLRDAESLLDQLSLLSGEITVDRVWDLVGAVPERDLMGLLEAIAQNDPEILLDNTRRLMDRGREPIIVLQNLASFYRDLLIAKMAPARSDLVALTPPTWEALCTFAQTLDTQTILAGQQHLRSSEVQLKHTTQPRLWLEVMLMGLLPAAIESQRSVGVNQSGIPSKLVPQKSQPAPPSTSQLQASTQQLKVQPAVSQPSTAASLPSPVEAKPPSETTVAATPRLETPETVSTPVTEPVPDTDNTAPDLGQIWQQIIAHLHPLSKALLAQHGRLLALSDREARIGISTEQLLKIAQNKVKDIEKAFDDVFHQKVRVTLEVVLPAIAANPVPQSDPKERVPAPAAYTPPPVPQAPSDGSHLRAPAPPDTVSNAPVRTSDPARNPTTPEPGKSPTSLSQAKPHNEAPAHTSSNPDPNIWEAEDDVAKAAQSLADFFGGKVITVSDEHPVTEIPTLEIAAIEDFQTKSVVDTWEDEEESELPF